MRIRWALAVGLAAGLLRAQDTVTPAEIEKLAAAATAHPDDVQARFDLALAYSIAGDDARAIPEYRKVLELAPDLHEAHANLGQVLLRAKRPAEAVIELRRAHEQKPLEFRPTHYLAESLFDLGQYAEALPLYETAAGIDPKSGWAQLGWGRTLVKLDRRAEGAPHYRQAAALDPQTRSYLLELAQAYETAKDYDTAVAIYREFPDNPGAAERAGVLSSQLGRDQEAVEALETAVRLSPTVANQIALAQAYVQHKDLEKAGALAAKLVASRPQDVTVRTLNARILRDQRKVKEAATEFEEVTRLKPDDAPSWSDLAGLRMALEQYPEALAAFDQLQKLGAEKEGHLFFRAVALDHLNRKKEALEYYQRFLERSRTNADQEFQARQRVVVLQREVGKK